MEKLNRNSHSKIQSESITSKNDSGFQDIFIENSLLLTNEEEHESLNKLNNRFAIYIEHIRNQEFVTKSNKTLEELSEIPSFQLEVLKSIYESEIKSLREALDKQSDDMAVLTIKNNKLSAEKQNYEIEVNIQFQQIKQMTESLHKSEVENAHLKTQLDVLQKNQTLIDNLSNQLKICQKQVENEVLLRTSSDNTCLTYKEKMEFNEAVFKKELEVMMATHRSALKKMIAFKNDIASSNLFEQMEDARIKLKEYLNEFLELVNDNFLDTINKTANSIRNKPKKLSKLKGANDIVLQDQHKLMIELEKVRASHVKLENHLSNIQTLNEEEINRLTRLVTELSVNKINELENSFNELKNLNHSMGEKFLLDTELTIYRKMLESEETRTNFTNFYSPATKRRKVTSESNEIIPPRKVLKATRQKKTCIIM